ncbi:MAG: hypothetical protein ACYDDF_11325 [Thermoplasmatota archaeon]
MAVPRRIKFLVIAFAALVALAAATLVSSPSFARSGSGSGTPAGSGDPSCTGAGCTNATQDPTAQVPMFPSPLSSAAAGVGALLVVGVVVLASRRRER